MLRTVVNVSLAVLLLAPPALAAEKGLVAHYDFTAGAGSVLQDRAGKQKPAKIVGAEWAEQRRAHALRFDGRDDYVDCGSGAEFNFKDAFTIALWVKPHSLPNAEPHLAGKGNRLYAMTYYKDADTWFYTNGRNKCGAEAPPGYWHQIVGTYARPIMRLYVDGRLICESPSTEPLLQQPDAHFFIGGLPKKKVKFKGLIGDVRVYDRALSSEEVWERYKTTRRTGRPEIRVTVLPSGRELLVEINPTGLGPIPEDATVEAVLVPADSRKAVARKKAPLRAWTWGELVLDVPHPHAAESEVWAAIADGAGMPIGRRAVHRFRWPDAPNLPRDVPAGKRLNNLVVELLNRDDLPRRARATYTFTNPRKGWVFISTAVDIVGNAPVRIMLDDATADNALRKFTKPRKKPAETMQHLSAGEHKLVVTCEGRSSLKAVIVRAIPEIVYTYFSRNWDFLKRNVFPHVTTIVGGEPERYRPIVERWRGRGRRWLMGAVSTPYFKNQSAEETYRFYTRTRGLTSPLADGILIDEYGSKPLDHYPASIKAMQRLSRNPKFKDREFIPYLCRLHDEFVKPIIEADYRFAWEQYWPEQFTRAEALRYAHQNLVAPATAKQKTLPGFKEHMVVVFGYMSKPTQTLNVYPHVNHLAWMDTQFNILANDPALEGTYGVSEYLSGYTDEETDRWAARLYRHYCIEGNRTLLMKDPYLLNQIGNPEFGAGAHGWKLTPAQAGSMEVRCAPAFGHLQGRYSWKMGDTYLWMRRSAKQPNAVSQPMRNLAPGRLYSVKAYSADHAGFLREGAGSDRNLALSFRVNGGDLLPDKSVQIRYKGIHKPLRDGAPKHKTWFNYHKHVFRAKGESALLTLSDWAAEDEPGGPVGQELMINFIEVQPYLE